MWGKKKGNGGYQPISTDFAYPSSFINDVFKLFSLLELGAFLFCVAMMLFKFWKSWDFLNEHAHAAAGLVVFLYIFIFLVETGIACAQFKSIREGTGSLLGNWVIISLVITAVELAVLYFSPPLSFSYSYNEGKVTYTVVIVYQLPVFVLWFFKALTTILSYKIFRFLKLNTLDEYSGIMTVKF